MEILKQKALLPAVMMSSLSSATLSVKDANVLY